MKKIVYLSVILVLLLLLVSSCYQNTVLDYKLEIVDNGVAADDNTCHIVTVIVPDYFNDIYYTLDSSIPTSNSIRYTPLYYLGVDSKSYYGILVKEGTTICAIAYRGTEHTFPAEEKIEFLKWKISIVDNGELFIDETMRIVTITDSLWSGDIYYTTDGSEPSRNSTVYSPAIYMNGNGEYHTGILVPEAMIVRAIAVEEVGDSSYLSYVEEKKLSTFMWNISILDNGPSLLDSSKHIITMSDLVRSGNIYYTLERSSPTNESSTYNPDTYVGLDGLSYEGILVSEGETVNAVSYLTIEAVTRMSPISSLTVESNPWTIEIKDNGSFSGNLNKHIISISDSVYGGDIYYTTNLSTPDSESEKYNEETFTGNDGKEHKGILIDEGETVKAISFKTEDGVINLSTVASQTIMITPWKINIVDNGQYSGDNTKHIISISDPGKEGTLYYTVGELTPTLLSNRYTPIKYKGIDGIEYEGILVNESTSVNAISYVSKNGYTGTSYGSSVIVEKYLWDIVIIDYGSYAEDLTKHIISITDVEKNGDIFYTTESTPDFGSTKYVSKVYEGVDGKSYNGILIDEGLSVKAISYKEEKDVRKSSAIVSKTIQIAPWAIQIIDNGQYFEDGSKHVITITDNVKNGTIYYSVDGQNPTSSSVIYAPSTFTTKDGTEYMGVLIDEGATLKAISSLTVNEFSGTSYILTETIEKYSWVITVTDFGSYCDDITKHIVAVSDSEKAGTIYYTIGNSIPDYTSTEYGPSSYIGSDGNNYTGILVSELATVNAVSYKTENGKNKSSYINSNKIKIVEWPIYIVDNGQSYDDGSKHIITITDSKRNGEIHYNTDGNTLDEISALYLPQKYKAVDGKEYEGILIKEGANLKAASFVFIGDSTGVSTVFDKTIDVSQWAISIVDNGVYANDAGKHIISISDSMLSGDIYYAFGNNSPNLEATKYSPNDYTGKDSETFNGVLVSVGDIISAISYKEKDGKQISSCVPSLELAYSIGDIGPSGGYIFYDCDADNDIGNDDGLVSSECGWRYLEAAANDLDSTYEYGGSGTNIGNTSTAVGEGKNNTNAIGRNLGNETYAAEACIDFTYGGYDDWFLPSENELYLMYINLYKNEVGSFKDNASYWSSSEKDDSYAWYQIFPNEYQYTDKRENTKYVRPVRAFDFCEGKIEHNWMETYIPPTCVDIGTTIYTCTDCGQTYTEIHWATGNHSYENYRCSVCGIWGKGPAGGYVFYDCDADNSSGNADGLTSDECGWRYLEAAPERLGWYYYGGVDIDVGILSEDIGAGKANTKTLVAEFHNNEFAAKACSEYKYNGYMDWFLPSIKELKLMYTNLYKNGLGIFYNSSYCSSTAIWDFSVEYLDFKNGWQVSGSRDQYSVHPVRSFR